MTQPTNFSVTTTKTPAASTPGGAAAKSPQAAGVVEARERTIAPPTTFNTETGLREDVKGGWTGKDGEKPAPAAKPKSGAEGKPAPTRHETWLAEQKAAREAREGKKTAKTAESQALARDFLKKGDLAGAANSLGMPSSELRELLLGGLLTTPTPDTELTPEQKKAVDGWLPRLKERASSPAAPPAPSTGPAGSRCWGTRRPSGSRRRRPTRPTRPAYRRRWPVPRW